MISLQIVAMLWSLSNYGRIQMECYGAIRNNEQIERVACKSGTRNIMVQIIPGDRAIVHTHPNNTLQGLSPQDIESARKNHILVYVICKSGVFVSDDSQRGYHEEKRFAPDVKPQ